MPDWVNAIILGIVEGLTEFIPVSSTGHLLLLGHFLGFESTGHTFEVMIQLGAVLAVISVYFARLWNVATHLHDDPAARRFVASILIAFLPAAFIGVLAHDFIKGVLFETPSLVCVSLIVGGFALLAVDRIKKPPEHTDAAAFPLKTSLAIGVFQCLAMIPGVSRSGATVAGALLLRCEKRAAAEFSFFLAMPTMAGAFTVDLVKNYENMSWDDAGIIALGFACALVAAVFTVRRVLDFVARHGFTPFAIWRIVVGVLGLIGLALLG
ncbi:undecaprenyl-diphosphate phosphatase [Phenylobacterium sp.]|uniref:undecaprenyl-diphosphate phosphatase n=1 Tax=Phenylobacterium sp. TaxID=1871053 RepID=UPI00301C6892